jgi:hypothetical protein
MDAALEHMDEQRLLFRHHVRQQLRDRGLLAFCDDDTDIARAAEAVYANVETSWRAAVAQNALPLLPVLASSTVRGPRASNALDWPHRTQL